MKILRRNFLKGMAGVCAAGAGGRLAADLIASQSAVAAPAAGAVAVTSGLAAGRAGAVAATAPAGAYGTGVRAQVFEVIVRQGMAGAPWREICAGPMQVNAICAADVEAEIERRRIACVPTPELPKVLKEKCKCVGCDTSHLETGYCPCVNCERDRATIRNNYKEKLAAIPHSVQAPCACLSCRRQVDNVITKIKRAVNDRDDVYLT
jgi:hypothetical protein